MVKSQGPLSEPSPDYSRMEELATEFNEHVDQRCPADAGSIEPLSTCASIAFETAGTEAA